MTSARDLLLQADALMRSNRNVGAADDAETVPMLTDVALPGGSGMSHNQRNAAIPVLTNAVEMPRAHGTDARGKDSMQELVSPSRLGATSAFDASRMSPTTIRSPFDAGADTIRFADALHLDVPEDPPSLFPRMRTDALQPPLDHAPEPPLLPAEEMLPPMDLPPMDEVETPESARPYEWPAEAPAILFVSAEVVPPEVARLEVARTAVGPTEAPWTEVAATVVATAAVVPTEGAPTDVAEVTPTEVTPTEGAPTEGALTDAVESAATQTAAQNTAEFAESVYYQVLQNLDLFTEKALQRELTAHLAPIIERANRELLATLHANLGGLLRQFIAEAIEKQLGVRPGSGDLSQ